MNNLISREEVIRLYCREHCGWEPEKCPLTYERDGIEECSFARLLKELPSVQPEQKKGHWINHGRYADFFPHCEYRCSECDTPYLEIEMIYNYCPNCGAKMDLERE